MPWSATFVRTQRSNTRPRDQFTVEVRFVESASRKEFVKEYNLTPEWTAAQLKEQVDHDLYTMDLAAEGGSLERDIAALTFRAAKRPDPL